MQNLSRESTAARTIPQQRNLAVRMSIVFLLVLTCLASFGYLRAAEGADPELAHPLGYVPTDGAAPGYLPDEACGTCHDDLYESYQQVGMARSFFRPRRDRLIEDLKAEPYFHEPSERYYQMRWENDRLVFRRYQLDDQKRQVNLLEQRVDWILGSGNRTRSYLFQTPAGELYQLPIGWYTEERIWRMAPGYDNPRHEGVQRAVRRECMFCHNGYPDVPAGSDTHWQAQVFPEDLPEGTGCQRCHGPGAEHVRNVIKGASDDEVRSAIVNPSRLPADRRDAVCNQCHLLPAVSLIGVRRFDRPDYSFRPGELLSDYMLHVDIEDGRWPREERFEINHHAYRLRQSACFIESGTDLACITCHDPHRKVSEAERAAHYAPVCLGCHEAHPVDGKIPSPNVDCTSCHMPERRAQDVVHVVMTDHRIQRPPAGDPTAALEETEPMLRSVRFLDRESSPGGVEGEIYKTVTVLRALIMPDLVTGLETLLAESSSEQIEPYLDLAMGQIKMKKFADAEQTLERVLENMPDHARTLQWLGIAAMGQGELERAEAYFVRGLRHDPESPELHFNLGLLLLTRGDDDAALERFDRATSLRPNMVVAWFYRGEASARSGDLDAAIDSQRRALAIEPSYTRSYIALAGLLERKDRRAEAEQVRRMGKKFAADPEAVRSE